MDASAEAFFQDYFRGLRPVTSSVALPVTTELDVDPPRLRMSTGTTTQSFGLKRSFEI